MADEHKSFDWQLERAALGELPSDGVDPKALAALRAGFKLIIFGITHPAAASVVGAAREIGAEVLGVRPPALDLGALDPRRRNDQARLAAHFATLPPQDQPT